MNKRIILAGLSALALVAPAQAQATGNHNPQPKPPAQDCGPCCRDLNQRIDRLELVWNQRFEQQNTVINDLRAQITQLSQRIENVDNRVTLVDIKTTTVINRVDALTCQSDRVYEFRLRTDVDGVPIASVNSVRVAGGTDRGSSRRNGGGRFVITADYRGITAPSLQFRTVMVNVRLANGQEADLVQYVRLCGADDGDPNDIPAQDRAGR